MDNRPVGVFDSGLGGLTALKELMRLMPNENYIYLGDTARVPYGSKSHQELIEYAKQDIAYLISKNVKYIVIACGTISSTLGKDAQRFCSVGVNGVVLPAAMAAAGAGGKIGIIGTTATIKAGAYKREISALVKDAQIFEKDCPDFVTLVEGGVTDRTDARVKEAVGKYLTSLREAEIETLVLGCTHYPMLREAISDFLPGVRLVDVGACAAKEAEKEMRARALMCGRDNKGKTDFFVTGDTRSFAEGARRFLGFECGEVHCTSLGEF